MNPRAKGANGEREAAKWIQSKFGLELCPQRNLEQVRSGGYDLIGFAPFCVEVKRCERIDKRAWWLQVRQCVGRGDIPIVMYRRNNQPWRFLIAAEYIGINKGFIHLEAREFILWAKAQIA